MTIRIRVAILCALAAFTAIRAIIDVDRDLAATRLAFAWFCLAVAVLTERFGRASR